MLGGYHVGALRAGLGKHRCCSGAPLLRCRARKNSPACLWDSKSMIVMLLATVALLVWLDARFVPHLLPGLAQGGADDGSHRHGQRRPSLSRRHLFRRLRKDAWVTAVTILPR